MLRTLPPVLALLAALALAPAPARAAAAPARSAAGPLLDLAQLHAGEKAEVRTVFQGDSVESFEAVIVGVLPGGRADGDLILARATSARVIATGVAQGMSGSPVYVGGRLVGALSSGWSFSREPIFGITPIREMLAVLDRPTSAGAAGSAGPSGVDLATGMGPGRFRELRWDDDDPVAAGAAPDPGAAPLPLALPLACAGFNPAAFDAAARSLAPFGLTVVRGGRAPEGGPRSDRLQPGSAVAVDILRGDLQMSAIGTLTWREGDRVLLFGHPFFQSGEVRLPLSTAEITTVLPNLASSFKLGVRGREVGVVTQDRRAAVAGRIGGSAHMLPLAVTVAAEGRAFPFRFESIEDRALAPTVIGLVAVNSLLESGGTGSNQTLEWRLELYRHGAPPAILHDRIAGDSPTQDLTGALGQPLRFLFNNPFERVRLDSVRVRLEVTPGREQWTLRNAQVLAAAVRPGGTVRLECELERWRGGREVRRLDLVVPEEVPEGNYILWVGGGSELTRYEARQLPARYRPTSLPDAWNRFAASRASDGLYAALYAKAPEVTTEGRDYPELPVSALALLASGQGAGDRSRRGEFAKLDERKLSLEGVTRGEILLQVRVEEKAP